MKANKTILFLHGALGTAQDLKTLMDLITAKGFQCLSFDFSGHGKVSAWPDEFRIDLFARELDKYITNHDLQDPIIFGHSMGGYVALYHKANFEHSPISQIITYGTKFDWSEKAVSKQLPLLDPEYLQAKHPAFVIALKEKHGERWKSLLRSTAHLMQNLEKLDGLTKEDLAEINIPVTLIRGEQDSMVSSEESNLIASSIKKAQLKNISNSQHELERTDLRELVQTITDL
jgi:pimeloyl-ACP methyl ester carboxylesterase